MRVTFVLPCDKTTTPFSGKPVVYPKPLLKFPRQRFKSPWQKNKTGNTILIGAAKQRQLLPKQINQRESGLNRFEPFEQHLFMALCHIG